MRIVEGAFDFLHSTKEHVPTMDGFDTLARVDTSALNDCRVLRERARNRTCRTGI